MIFEPFVSIIINTDGRAKSLAVTLESLRHLHYENFEVIVVYGPTLDGTRELLENWVDDVKIAHIPRRNLSESRNISLAMAAGELVAFLDDDSIPEAEWLNKVTQPFMDPTVAAAGGFLFDHTGVTYQWRFGTANRTGSADESWQRPAPELNFPYSANIPHVMANSAFRLSALMEIGGFDEQYVYFLDETDAICRLVDSGWRIVQMEGAPVHHKFLASHLRNDARILTSWYQILRSKMYFGLVNAQGHHDTQTAIEATKAFGEALRGGLTWHISQGKASPELLEKFAEEYEAALRDGLLAGLQHTRILYDAKALGHFYSDFRRFPTLKPADERRCICLLSRWYSPETTGGIGRYVEQLGQSLACLGHQVHVLTESDRETVDFEAGVWVHRRRRQSHTRPPRAVSMNIPQHIWDYSATMRSVAEKIALERPIDAVLAPIWDCEGIAFLLDPTWPLATSLHTTLASYLATHVHRTEDHEFMDNFAKPMLACEREILLKSPVIIANSNAIVEKIESEYRLQFNQDRLMLVPHGLGDWSLLSRTATPAVPSGAVRMLFVGRLEERKGADVLLAALDLVLDELPNLYVDLVGNHALETGAGVPFREAWLAKTAGEERAERVTFHGEVDDESLRGFYAAADMFVAPSRFESFGLIFLEAMIFGKPTIGCRAGGIPEVVSEGITGILVEPGNVEQLADAIRELVRDSELRERLGSAGRDIYLENFAPQRMAQGVLDGVSRLKANTPTGTKAVAGA